MSFSGAVRIVDGFDDYLSPAQNCVLPLMQTKEGSVGVVDAGANDNGPITLERKGIEDEDLDRVTVAFATVPSRRPIPSSSGSAQRKESNSNPNAAMADASTISSTPQTEASEESTPSIVKPKRIFGRSSKPKLLGNPDVDSAKSETSIASGSTATVSTSTAPQIGSVAAAASAATVPPVVSASAASATTLVPGANFAQIKTKTSDGVETATVSLTDCLACSGCVTSAETILIGLQSKVEFLRILSDIQKRRRRRQLTASDANDGMGLEAVSTESKSQTTVQGGENEAADANLNFETCILSLSPQSRISLSNALGLEEAVFARRLALFFHALGVDLVLDTTTAADIALLEAQYEFLREYIRRLDGASSSLPDIAFSLYPKLVSMDQHTPQLNFPLLTSECPGWVCYAEKTQPAPLIEHMSQVKSPQQILGSIVKRVIPKLQREKRTWQASKIFHVAVMPCFDKKLEASRDDFVTYVTANADGEEIDSAQSLDDMALSTVRQLKIKDVDLVIATTELLDVLLGNTAAAVSEDGKTTDGLSTETLAQSFQELLPQNIKSFAELWHATESAAKLELSSLQSSQELATSTPWIASSTNLAHIPSESLTDEEIKADPMQVSSYYRSPGTGASGGYADTIFRHSAAVLFGVPTASQQYKLFASSFKRLNDVAIALPWLAGSNSDMRAVSLEYIGSATFTDETKNGESCENVTIGVYLLLGKDCAMLLPGMPLSSTWITALDKAKMGLKYSQWRAKAGCRSEQKDGTGSSAQPIAITGLAGAVHMRLGATHENIHQLVQLANIAPEGTLLAHPAVRSIFSFDDMQSEDATVFDWNYKVWAKLAGKLNFARPQQDVTLLGEKTHLREGEVPIPSGLCLLWFAQAYGFRNIQNVVRQCNLPRSVLAAAQARVGGEGLPRRNLVTSGIAGGGAAAGQSYHYVEVMACPSGCLNGGGQLRPQDIARAQLILGSTSSTETLSTIPSLCATTNTTNSDSNFTTPQDDTLTSHSVRAQKALVAKLDSMFHRPVSLYPEFNPVARDLYTLVESQFQTIPSHNDTPVSFPTLPFVGGKSGATLFTTTFKSLTTSEGGPLLQAPKW